MPVNAALTEFNDSGTRNNNGDPYLLNVKEASIVRQRLYVDAPYEADMLKHKARILFDLAAQHDLVHKIPRLDFMEEARTAQYRSECIAAACFQRGLDPNHLLRTASSAAPISFRPWLSRTMGEQDPIFASAKIIGSRMGERFRTYRCPDFTCRNYVYGFTSQEELDKHLLLHKSLDAEEHFRLTHVLPGATGTAGSASNTAVNPADEPQKLSPLDIANILSPEFPAAPSSVTTSSTAVASDGTMSPTLSAYSNFGDAVPPPYESQRPTAPVPPPRLESIEELGLPSDQAHSVGCPISENQPCTCDMVKQQEDGQWLLSQTAEDRDGTGKRREEYRIVQRYRRDIDQYLRKSLGFPDAVQNMVRESADFHDGFWRTFDMVVPITEEEVLTEVAWTAFSPPSATLCTLATWWNPRAESYSILTLLAASGTLSKSRSVEEKSFPVLAQAKKLLREALLLGLTGKQPFLGLGPMTFYPPVPDDTLLVHQTVVVQTTLKQFIQMFEESCRTTQGFAPREWLPMFVSICIFTVAASLLSEAPDDTLTRLIGSEDNVMTSDAFYESFQNTFRILAEAFGNAGANLLDSPTTTVPTEDTIPFEHTYKAIHCENWNLAGFASTTDFLYSLADLEPSGGVRSRREYTPTGSMTPESLSSYPTTPDSQQSHVLSNPGSPDMPMGWVPVPMRRLASGMPDSHTMDVDMTREQPQQTNGVEPPQFPGYGSPVPGYSGPVESPSSDSETEGRSRMEWPTYGSLHGQGPLRRDEEPSEEEQSEHSSQQEYELAMTNGYHGDETIPPEMQNGHAVNGHAVGYAPSQQSSLYSSSHTASEHSVPMSPSDASTPRAPSDVYDSQSSIAYSDFGSRRESGFGSRRPSEYDPLSPDTNGTRTPRAASPRPSTASTAKHSVSFAPVNVSRPAVLNMTSPNPISTTVGTFDFGGPPLPDKGRFNFTAASSAEEHLAQVRKDAEERKSAEPTPGPSSQSHPNSGTQAANGPDPNEGNFFAFRATAPPEPEIPAAEEAEAGNGGKKNQKRKKRVAGAGVKIKASYQRPPAITNCAATPKLDIRRSSSAGLSESHLGRASSTRSGQ